MGVHILCALLYGSKITNLIKTTAKELSGVEKSKIPNQYIRKDLTNGLADIDKNDSEGVAKILASWIGE
ncbi:MAG: hypothetical protein KIG96_03080 [Treponema sp.]|nr:hypothetical protein [Treponema sp.]